MTRVAREIAEAILLAILFFLILQISIQNFRVEGYSMQPTLNGGEFVIVNKLRYAQIETNKLSKLVPWWQTEEGKKNYTFFSGSPQRGDIVVFRSPSDGSKDLVKRVIGLPGEKITIAQSKVLVDNQMVEEWYMDSVKLMDNMDCVPNTDNCTLGEHEYFVMGDNRRVSSDSRDWGPVDLNMIIGKVLIVYWPMTELSNV